MELMRPLQFMEEIFYLHALKVIIFGGKGETYKFFVYLVQNYM